MSKKAWIKEHLDEGLVFLKGNVRGKCYIEYIPAEWAWAPIDADGYMYIDCLWIAGQFKGHGHSNLLLEECIKDSRSKGKKGLVISSSIKKMGFLSDPKYLRHKGFETADPSFELIYLPFEKNASKPQFKQHVKEKNRNVPQNGFSLYYTNQCPFTAKYVPLLEKVAESKNIDFQSIHIDTKEKAQNAPSPFTTFSLFYTGKFIIHNFVREEV